MSDLDKASTLRSRHNLESGLRSFGPLSGPNDHPAVCLPFKRRSHEGVCTLRRPLKYGKVPAAARCERSIMRFGVLPTRVLFTEPKGQLNRYHRKYLFWTPRD